MVPLAEIPHLELLQAFCFGQLLAQLPLLASCDNGRRTVLLLALVGGFLVLSYLPAFLPLSVLLTIAGAVVLVSAIYKLSWPALRGSPWTLPVLILLATLAVGYIYGIGFLTPLYLKRILLNNVHYIDSIFHMSIAGMFKTFSIPSTGLDGIPFLSYHTGSHYLLSRITALFTSSSLNAYIIYYPCVWLPFFWVALALCVQSVQRVIPPRDSDVNFGTSCWLLLLFFLALIPYEIGEKASAWIRTLFISESFFLSVAFSFIFCSLLAHNILAHKAENDTLWQRITILVAMIISGFLTTACKVSTGFALCCLSGTLFLMFWKKVKGRHIIAMVIFAVGNILIAKMTIYMDHTSGFEYFHFIRTYAVGKYLLWHIVFHHGSLFILFLLQRLRNQTWNPCKFSYPDKVILGAALFVTVCTLLPATLITLGAGGEWYFSMVRWWLMPVCMAYVAAGSLPSLSIDITTQGKHVHIAAHKGVLTAMAVLALCVLLAVKHAGYDSLYRLKDEAKEVRRIWVAQNAKPEDAAKLKERCRIIYALLELQKAPANEKQNILVNIPWEYEAFWDSSCFNDFLIPALSEHAALESISENTPYPFSGYTSYPTRAELIQGERSDEYLLERAQKLGFSRVATWREDGFVLLSTP
jgi:cell division protein FtsW (lipid II flippase)